MVLSGQQKAYEQIRAERNSYSRDLIAAQAEVAEAKRKFARVVSPPLWLLIVAGQMCGLPMSTHISLKACADSPGSKPECCT